MTPVYLHRQMTTLSLTKTKNPSSCTIVARMWFSMSRMVYWLHGIWLKEPFLEYISKSLSIDGDFNFSFVIKKTDPSMPSAFKSYQTTTFSFNAKESLVSPVAVLHSKFNKLFFKVYVYSI